MITRRKICAITANRADFSRIETILRAAQAHPRIELQLVVIGGHLSHNTGRTVQEIEKKGFHIDRCVETHVDGSTPATMTKSVAKIVDKLVDVITELKPDVIIAPTDRFETLAIAVAASLMNVIVAHIQGGEVTGTIDESIRHAVTKLSHLHFVSTKKSRDRVIKMGESKNLVFNVGCPATDLLLSVPMWTREQTIAELNKLLEGRSLLDHNKPYILLMQHPVTTEYGQETDQVKSTIAALNKFDIQVIALFPNIDAGGKTISEILLEQSGRDNFHLFHHIPTEIFVNVLRHAAVQVGNSSSGIREAGYFGTPVVNIGTRQNSRERGKNVISVPNQPQAIERAVRLSLKRKRYPIQRLYGDGTAGKQIIKILSSIKLPPVQKKITY